MKIVLQKRIGKLGLSGDVAVVKDGYARNFLLPNGLAKLATPIALKEVDELKKKAEQEKAEQHKELEERLGKLNGKAIDIPAKADADGNLFGSVTAKDVLRQIEEDFGVDIGGDDIDWTPQKKVGTYTATIEPEPDMKAELTITISPA